MPTNHTPEPWNISDDSELYIEDYNGNDIGDVFLSDHPKADAERIVACVNALAGVPDPAAFVKSHAELLESARKVLRREYAFVNDSDEAAPPEQTAFCHLLETAIESAQGATKE